MAGRFVFKLETVLRARRRTFEDAQRVVATRLGAIGAEQATVAAIHGQVDEQLAASRAAQRATSVDVGLVRNHRMMTQFLHRRIAECEARIRGHEELLVAERAAMVEANVAVKALEKLKERRQARFNEERERRERIEQDDLSLEVYRRRQMEPECSAVHG